MPAHTSKYQFPYPVGTDQVSTIDDTVKSLAEKVESRLSSIDARTTSTAITQQIQAEVNKATGTALSIGQSVILGQQRVNFINDNIKYETVSIPRQANNRYHVFVTCEALGNVVYAASIHQKEVDKFYLRVAQVNATRSNATVLVNYMIIKAD